MGKPEYRFRRAEFIRTGRMNSALQGVWRFIRRLSGDDAYERYLRHHAEAHPHEPALNRKAYFRQEQDRKWNGIRRCC